MNIEEQFAFLVNDYNMKYSFQRFKNYPFGNWSVDMYSFYNESGCFSIYNIAQRDEIDYYYAKKISSNIDELKEKSLEIGSIGKEIWKKAQKKFLFSFRHGLINKTLAEVIKEEVQKTGQFFGIKV